MSCIYCCTKILIGYYLFAKVSSNAIFFLLCSHLWLFFSHPITILNQRTMHSDGLRTIRH